MRPQKALADHAVCLRAWPWPTHFHPRQWAQAGSFLAMTAGSPYPSFLRFLAVLCTPPHNARALVAVGG